MKSIARPGLLALCIAGGCSEKELPPPPRPVTVAPQTAPAIAPKPFASASPSGTTAATATQAREQPMDLNSLDSVLQDYANATGRVPKTFQEMVNLKLIPHLPQVPAGKHWVIDTVQIRIKEK